MALWTDILAATRATDWTTAGVEGGIPSVTTKYGATLASTTTRAQLNTAITNASAAYVSSGLRQYIYLGAGTFTMNDTVVMKNGVTLRGQGMSTVLNFTAMGSGNDYYWGAGMVGIQFQGADQSNEADVPGLTGCPSAVINWTGTGGSAGVYSQGATVINLASAPGCAAGDTLLLWESDDADASVPNSGYFVSAKVAASGAVSREGSSETNLTAQQQRARVLSVNGSAVTIATPLRLPTGCWRSALNPKAGWLTAAQMIHDAGVESLRIVTTSVSGALGAIGFNWAANCWVKGVGIVPRTGTWHSGNGTDYGIYITDSRNLTINNNWVHRMVGGGLYTTTSYGIALKGCFDSLIENNILNQVESPLMILGISTGNVFGYNYEYYSGDDSQEGGFQQHQVGSSMNLVEGHSVYKMWADCFHGNTNLNTYFRNYLQTRGFDINSYHRWHNLIGNCIGASTIYKSLYSDSTKYDRYSSFGFRFGYSGPNASAAATDGVACEAGVNTTAMLWGNYCTTGGTRWLSAEVPSGDATFPNPVPGNQTLPGSFYRTSRPGFFVVAGIGTVAWPPIGPDVTGGDYLTGKASKLPAQLVYEAAGGAVASFNPTLYGSDSGSSPPVGTPVLSVR